MFGVLDFIQWPVHGKKGRMAIAIHGLVRPDATQQIIQTNFNETSTLGVRYRNESRKILNRSIHQLEESRIKLVERPSRENSQSRDG